MTQQLTRNKIAASTSMQQRPLQFTTLLFGSYLASSCGVLDPASLFDSHLGASPSLYMRHMVSFVGPPFCCMFSALLRHLCFNRCCRCMVIPMLPLFSLQVAQPLLQMIMSWDSVDDACRYCHSSVMTHALPLQIVVIMLFVLGMEVGFSIQGRSSSLLGPLVPKG